MSNLPGDIIADILSRLPVKTICRFRCVSTLWRSLFSAPHFIKTHLARHSKHERLILVSESYDLCSVDLESSDDGDGLVAMRLQFPNPKYTGCILGSCNGLLLLLHENSCLFLVNPSTGESRELPKSHFTIDSIYWLDDYGLGYDSSTDDYKVARICHHPGRCSSDNVVSVYSLRNNSWRRIADSPYHHSNDEPRPGVFASGALHWIAISGKGSNESDVIASLDLATENFRHVPVLCCLGLGHLGVVGGYLYVCSWYPYLCQDFWMMKEYGVGDSWTKLRISLGHRQRWEILCFARTGKAFIGWSRHRLVLFDPLSPEETCKELVVRGCPAPIDAGAYVESLVSPITTI